MQGGVIAVGPSGVVVYEQAPANPAANSRNSNSLTNEESNQQVADDFVVTGENLILSGLDIWYTYTNINGDGFPVDARPPALQNLSVRIFDDVAGNPGSILFEEAITFVPIGTGVENGRDYEIFTAGFGFSTRFEMEEGARYWLSPIGLNDEDPWSWQFHDDGEGERRTRYGDRPNDPTWRPFVGEFAYRIYAIPEPSGAIMLALASVLFLVRRRGQR